MFDAVLFDLDGTLISYQRSYADFLKRVAASWDISEQTPIFFETYRSAILSEGPVTFQSAVTAALVATGLPTPEDSEAKCQAAVIDYANGTELLPWGLELVQRYRLLPTAIVSNGPFDMQLAAIHKSGLHLLVDQVIISGDAKVAVRKPNPAIFHLACDRLGVKPSRTLMIGDNEEADIAGAIAAGLQAVHVSAAKSET